MSRTGILLACCFSLLFTGGALAQQIDQVYSPESVTTGEVDRTINRLKLGTDGEVYAFGNVLVRLTGPDAPEEIIRVTGTDSTYSTPHPALTPRIVEVYGVPYSGELAFSRIGDIQILADGAFYASAPDADMVVRIAPDGALDVILDSSHPSLIGDFPLGSPLDQPEGIVLDSEGNLYVANVRSHNIVKLSSGGEVTQVLNSEIAATEFFRPHELVVDAADNIYSAASAKLFKIAPDGSHELLIDGTTTIPQFLDDGESFKHLTLDKYGNLYFATGSSDGGYSRHSDLLFRLTPEGTLSIVFSESGDGTGAAVSEISDDNVITGHSQYGNFVLAGTRPQLDAAQNVYIAEKLDDDVAKIFRIDLSGSITVVASMALSSEQILNYNSFPVLDAFGNFYFIHQNRDVFKIAPIPIEAEIFTTTNPAESHELLDRHWINWVSQFSRTDYSFSRDLPDAIAILDTREEPLSRLPWQDAILVTTSSTLEPDGSLSEVLTSTLSNGSALYRARLYTNTPSGSEVTVINRIEFEDDHETIFSAEGLNLPLVAYESLSGEDLMRRLYVGNDVIYGGFGDDSLYGFAGHDILYGMGGDDRLHGGADGNTLSGSGGNDVAVFDFNQEDYAISRNPISGWVSVQAKIGYGGPFPDQIAPDVEQLKFADSAIDTSEILYWGRARRLVVKPKEAVTNPEVYRFFNSRDKAFFFTTSVEERDQIIRYSYGDNELGAYWPFVYQGAQFGPAMNYPDSVPLYRFYNYRTGHHFFTANESERDLIDEQINSSGWPFIYEGIAFHVYASDPTPNSQGLEVPVHRFYSHTLDRHFFTSDMDEVDALHSSSNWQYEGIGFYAESL